MITTLQIKNIGIIDDIKIELDQGFNVFTGETGAGKTLIIDAINLILGERFSKEIIRKGRDNCFVELNVFLPENDRAEDGNIIISREINLNGKNSCKINGRLVTVSELKEFMHEIIDIHGQNDNLKILDKKNQINYLDDFCGTELSEIKKEYKKLYKDYLEIKRKLKENLSDDKERQRKIDLLEYEIEEIENANLNEKEEQELKEKRSFYLNYEKIVKNINISSKGIDNAYENLAESVNSIEKIVDLDEKYKRVYELINDIYYNIEEAMQELSRLKNTEYYDENEIDIIESRINIIQTLKRKYGNSIKDILEYLNKIKEELYRIENLEEENKKLNSKKIELEAKMLEKASEMRNIRIKFSDKLNEDITNVLVDLEMKKAKFISKVTKNEKLNENGIDDVEFYISTNMGDLEKPLIKIASGGEMSRIMLAIKYILAKTDKTPVMIFDEIDTGISGKSAKSVGKKLMEIGTTHQVICVTHQPSIAACGDNNFYIYKIEENDRTQTKVRKLEEQEVLEEIARISSGEVTKTSIEHAKELRGVRTK